MKVNRIQWSEEMNNRCLKRFDFIPDKKSNGTVISNNYTTKNNNYTTGNKRIHPSDETYLNTHAIGVGEFMECELITGRISTL